jgi:hypothetical protein
MNGFRKIFPTFLSHYTPFFAKMAERKFVSFDEFYYQLKLMHLFLLHPVCHKTSLDGEFLPFKVFKTALVLPEKRKRQVIYLTLRFSFF